LPLVVIFLPVTWFYLTHNAVPPKIRKIPGGKDIIEHDLKELGRVRLGE
jgi:sodium-dependent dicarboxylate transporter 2/3/5